MYFVLVRICGKQSAPAMATTFVENGALRGTSVAGAHDLAGWLASVVHPPAPRLPRRSIQIPSFGSNFRPKIC